MPAFALNGVSLYAGSAIGDRVCVTGRFSSTVDGEIFRNGLADFQGRRRQNA